jgi:hypothetical protein
MINVLLLEIGLITHRETLSDSGLFTGGIVIPAGIELSVAPTSFISPSCAALHEMTLDTGTIEVHFGSLNGDGAGEFEESQVVRLCRDHTEDIIKVKGSTIMRIRDGLVAAIDVVDGVKPRVTIYPFSHPGMWGKEFGHRLVALRPSPEE